MSCRGRGQAAALTSGSTAGRPERVVHSVCPQRRASDRRLLVFSLDRLIMLPVLQVIGQLVVVGLLRALLWRFALKSKQKRLFGARKMINWIAAVAAGGGRGLCLTLQPTTRGSLR